MLSAFILAEQRDQSRNEDAKDLIAATSFKRANTSIGLGQVVVSTARRNDLFADLLSKPTRTSLSHEQIARLLASDEFNIFAVAKYNSAGRRRCGEDKDRAPAEHPAHVPRHQPAGVCQPFLRMAGGQFARPGLQSTPPHRGMTPCRPAGESSSFRPIATCARRWYSSDPRLRPSDVLRARGSRLHWQHCGFAKRRCSENADPSPPDRIFRERR